MPKPRTREPRAAWTRLDLRDTEYGVSSAPCDTRPLVSLVPRISAPGGREGSHGRGHSDGARSCMVVAVLVAPAGLGLIAGYL